MTANYLRYVNIRTRDGDCIDIFFRTLQYNNKIDTTNTMCDTVLLVFL